MDWTQYIGCVVIVLNSGHQMRVCVIYVNRFGTAVKLKRLLPFGVTYDYWAEVENLTLLSVEA